MKKLIIIGAGGHGKSVEFVAKFTNCWDEILFLDDENINTKVVGRFEDRIKFIKEDFFVAIGSNPLRKTLIRRLENEGFNIVSIISPNSNITNSIIGIGSIVMNNVFINVDSSIGDGVVINNCVLIEHDCHIGHSAHLSPNVSVAGTSRIGNESWLGIGSTVSNNITIEDKIIVGAGSVVVDNLNEAGTYVGIPAKRIK